MRKCIKVRVRRSFHTTAVLMASALPAAPLVFAQESPVSLPTTNAHQTLKEITVTATRREEPLNKVPMSVAAFSQDQMDAQGVRSIADIARLTPGLQFTPVPGGSDVAGTRTSISIRGITSLVGSATTGVYIDNTPIQIRSLGNIASNVYPQIFDLERVEVLKGPQGTLFGAGAEGGAVRFILPEPSLDHYSVYGRSEYSYTQDGAPSSEVGLAVGAPVVADKLGVYLSAWYQDQGGWIDRIDPYDMQTEQKNANSAATSVLHGAVKFAPFDGFTATLSLFHQKQNIANPSLLYESMSNLGDHEFSSGSVIDQPMTQQFTLPSLDLDYDAGPVRLISTTSYFTRDSSLTSDYTNFIGTVLLGSAFAYNPGQYSLAYMQDSQRDFTQEIRLQSNTNSALSWTIGGFYDHSRQTTNQVNVDPYLNAALTRIYGLTVEQFLGAPLINGSDSFVNNAHSLDEQKAVFGQASYEILKGLTLTAGVRAAKTSLTTAGLANGPVAGPVAVANQGSESETPVTPKYGISYQFNENDMAYVSVAKGYRIGGANGQQIGLCQSELRQLGLTGSPSTYNSDYVWSYEIGTKDSLADGRVAVSGSVFDINWSHIQQEVRLAGCGSGFITNFGSAESTGFDLSINARATDSLLVSLNAGLADARLTQTMHGPGTTVFGYSGDKLPVPPWQVAASGEYDFPILNRSGYFRADDQYISHGPRPDSNVFGADPTIPGSGSYNDLSLRTGISDAGWDISVFVNNLLNQAPLLSRDRATTTSPLYFDTTVQPRTFGITAVYRHQ